jgi:hypothetical protein
MYPLCSLVVLIGGTPCVSLRHNRDPSSHGKYKYDTWRILPVRCYINNFVLLRSYINKHFWHRCLGGSQYLLSIYRLHRIILTSIISLTDLLVALCLFMVFTGSCMTGFNLLANYHSGPESLIRKSRSRLLAFLCHGILCKHTYANCSLHLGVF